MENKFSFERTKLDKNSNKVIEVQVNKVKKSKYEMVMNSVAEQNDISEHTNEIPIELLLEREIELFQATKSTKIVDSFWLEHQYKMPILFSIYKQLKSVSPTNAVIERLFSKAKLVFSDMRQSFDFIEPFLM